MFTFENRLPQMKSKNRQIHCSDYLIKIQRRMVRQSHGELKEIGEGIKQASTSINSHLLNVKTITMSH